MITRLHQLAMRWAHARPRMLSRYLEDDLTKRERLALEAHLHDCPRCRALLQSLARTIRELGALRSRARPGLADSVIAALRATSPSPAGATVRSSRHSGSPLLAVVPDVVPDAIEPTTGGPDTHADRLGIVRALLGYCLRGPQLRFTLPIAALVGVALSLTDQGAMLLHRQLDLATCVGLNLLVPFIALNVGLVLATRVTQRRRL